MPYFRRRRRTTRRTTRPGRRFRRRTATYRRRRGRRGGSGKRYNKYNPLGFPNNKIVTFKYNCYYNLAPDPLGPLATVVFRTNSIFDPEVSFGGHKPMGVDQWGAFYQQYCVIGSKITARVSQARSAVSVASEGAGSVFGIILSRNPAPPSTVDVQPAMEQGLGTWRYSNLTGKPSSVSLGYSAKRYWNIQSVKDNWSFIGAGFGADPTYQSYWSFYYGALDYANATPSAITVNFTIRYKCILSVPQYLPQS